MKEKYLNLHLVLAEFEKLLSRNPFAKQILKTQFNNSEISFHTSQISKAETTNSKTYPSFLRKCNSTFLMHLSYFFCVWIFFWQVNRFSKKNILPFIRYANANHAKKNFQKVNRSFSRNIYSQYCQTFELGNWFWYQKIKSIKNSKAQSISSVHI